MSKTGKPVGRPSAFKPEHVAKVIELGRAGKSKAQMCAEFEVSRQTIDNWADSNPDFAEAMAVALVHAQAWWENAGQIGMVSDKFNAAVWKKTVESRFRDDYTERHELSGPDGGVIRLTISSSDADL